MERNNNFNFMRLIFAFMVVYSHSYGLLTLPEPHFLGRTLGNLAVHCFFVLSGYLITISYLNSKNTIDFFKKRALRLIPAFLIAYFLSRTLSSVFNKFIDNPVPYIFNGTIWTLSWEVLAYVICALIGFAGILTPSILGAFWITSYVYIIINYGSSSPTYQVIVPMLFLFLSGGFIAVNEQKLKLTSSGLISILVLSILAFIPELPKRVINTLYWLYGPEFPQEAINYFLYLMLLPLAIIYLGKYIPLILKAKNDISYGVYIYAWPIQQTIIFLFLRNNVSLHPLLLFALSSIITAITSYFSWRFIEKPALSLKQVKLSNLFSNKDVERSGTHTH
ncbi:acyltransferase [Schinkia azotoformans]|uniref:Acetyltransferase n=1 Tax=Schinkia azotoformans LMG 9581 TaxID=1131731 RepID=K6CRA0_SCHAZ|nr:acyltransferase [Schinkia azotoformans]EKN62782.1 acetyltransferase [Schinkia azotoformans LMG 9581]MEC1639157.1 acyltransferase [Schinkia azotoformans]MEC1945745.1 acyltransferase [Schinkia azotoformans]